MAGEARKSHKIAERIRTVRMMRGVNQKDVADEMGRSKATVSNWEKYGNISFIDAVKLAEIYEVTLDELCGRTPISF